MADQRSGGIAWTDATWNPVRGCSRVSEGCRNCYAERFAARFSGEEEGFESAGPQGWITTKAEGRFHGFAEMTKSGPRWTGRVEPVHGKFGEPLRWRKPRRVFVNSMSDLFHEKLRDEQLDEIFGVMLGCAVLDMPRHTFQVLTKRPERMRRYFTERSPSDLVEAWAKAGDGTITMGDADVLFSEYVWGMTSHDWRPDHTAPLEAPSEPWKHLRGVWPLPNVWLGVSVEDQKSADERIPLLLETPAAVRFISAEPLLGPVNLGWLPLEPGHTGTALETSENHEGDGVVPALDWVIVGGESGPGARPCDVAWIRDLVRQCRDASVAVFVKQLGANIHHPTDIHGWPGGHRIYDERDRVRIRLKCTKGGDPAEWPEDLRVREFPVTTQ